ncbi:ATP-binding protein [Saccharomonospora sp. NPDC006951]
MCSSRRADRRRSRSLRGTLLIRIVALFTAVCLLIGVVTEVALRAFLVDKLDEQLLAASGRAHGIPGPATAPMASTAPTAPKEPPPEQFSPRDPIEMPGLGVGTFIAVLDGSDIVSAERLAGPDAARQDLPESQYQVLRDLPPDGKPYSRTLGDFGDYRMAAVRTEAGTVIVTGLPLSEVADTLWSAGLILGGVALGGVVVTGLIGAVTIRGTLRPLDRLAAIASKVTELPLDKGEVALSVRVPDRDTDTRTEVGKVGMALDRMLGHVGSALEARQRSESRVRRFVADASHELRTPLAAIRGYAELVARHGDTVARDVGFAIGRVESESRRMTNLVEELLLLARLDAGRPSEREQVDLSRLVADAVADAHVAGPGHTWVLDAPADPVTVSGDAEQLQQVVLNLLSNARSHTPSGTTVVIELAAERERAVLRVRDDGPGIPPELLPEVFERFARGDSSRSRTAGGTGLGLAIVAAVVAAHHGTVRVESSEETTEFTVDLPSWPPVGGVA